MEAYYGSVEKCHDIWRLYHLWYDDKRDPEVLKKCKRLLKGEQKDVKMAFYREIRKRHCLKSFHWRRYRNISRISVFAVIFYNKTHVDISFAKKTICDMLI
tara:strand:- start:983 stop:1285 length:303 start_codon:yes stop_codon:yes gene_type:complete